MVQLTPDNWPSVCLSPRNSLTLDLNQVPPRYTVPVEWNNRQQLDRDLIYLIVKGQMQIHVGPIRTRLQPGSVIWVPAGQTIHFSTVGQRPLLHHRFRFRLCSPGGDPMILSQPCLHIEHCWAARPLMDLIFADLASPDPHSTSNRRSLVAALTTLIIREYQRKQAQPGGLSTNQKAILENAISEMVSSWPTVAELADLVSLTPDYFSRQFRLAYGCRPGEWLIEHRIRLATALLRETTLSIGEIADRLGYRDIYYFSRQYSQITGKSPSETRRYQ